MIRAVATADAAPAPQPAAQRAAGGAEFPRYISAQLHCHSSIEGPASIGAHCYEAQRAGVEVVWLTDHDTRLALHIGGPFVGRFDFEGPDLTTVVEHTGAGRTVRRKVGWGVTRRDEGLAASEAELTRERCYTGTQSLRLEAQAGEGDDDWRSLLLDFKADSKMHGRPLLSEATIGLALFLEPPPAPADAEAWLDLVLSEQPPDLRQARLRYLVAGEPEGHRPEEEVCFLTRILPLDAAAGAWRRFELRPAGDAWGEPGGEDNALGAIRLGLRVRRGARLRLFVDDLTITHRFSGDELHARQRAMARKLAQRYGVVCHVAQEISQAGPHKNAWGASVPVMDYARQSLRATAFTHADGIAWARRHGAVFSLNHPFSKYGNLELTGADRERIVADVLENYATTRVSGADTLEVGFPAGRHGFAMEDYLRLWDGLSRRGVIVTGSGSSDAHSAKVGWQRGNNFATRIRSDSTDEASLLVGLRSGDLYPADPVLFRTRLRFCDGAGHRMGQVVVVDGGSGLAEVEVALEQAQSHWVLRWVVNGERQPALPLPDGPATQALALPLPGRDQAGPSFVRAEVWDLTHTPDGDVAEGATGRCIALTNPMWYVREVPEGVGEERLRGPDSSLL